MIGQRIRALRTQRGMSLRQLALLSGMSKGHLSKVERGEAGIDQRRSLRVVAEALGVPPSELTGQPYDPTTRAENAVRVAVADIRDVLYGSTLGERYDDPTTDLDALTRTARHVADLHSACAMDRVGPLLPDLLTGLYAHAADPRGDVQRAAVRLLVPALDATRNLTHWAGEAETAHRASEQAVAAAGLVDDDPSLLGFAQFGLAHSLEWVNGRTARHRAAAVASRAADHLQQHAAQPGPAAEMYGMLRLIASWTSLLVGRDAEADDHFAEAAATAARTGEGDAHRLWFGPNNVAAWRLTVAIERQEGGRTRQLAAAVNAAALPARERQAGHWINVGRGLAQEPATAGDAVAAFQRARRLAPIRTRLNPHVREVTERLAWNVGGSDLLRFAEWLGVIPT